MLQALQPKLGDIVTENKKLANEIIKFLGTLRIEYFDERYYKIAFPITEKDNQKGVLKLTENYPEKLRRITFSEVILFIPSVTTILGFYIDPFVPKWRGDVGNVYADYIANIAMELGSRIHYIINLVINGYHCIYNNPKNPQLNAESIQQYKTEVHDKLIIIESQEVALQIARFERICDAFNPEILASEQSVFNLKEMYAGTLDQIWKIADINLELGRNKYNYPAGTYVVDIKTGKNIDEWQYFAQLAAYAETQEDITGAIILHLNANIRTGIEGVKLYMKTKDELKCYYDYFLRTRDNYLSKNNPQPVNYEIPVLFNKSYNLKGKENGIKQI